MDHQTPNTEKIWVDRKLAALVPPADWSPNSNRAYSEFLKRREGNEPEASPSWVRVSMAAAILASIALVVALLPWNALWKPAAKNPEIRLTAPKAVDASRPIEVPEPIRKKTTQPPLSQPALSQPALSQPGLPQPALSQPTLSQAATLGHGTGGGIPQNAPTAQEPGQKPAERVGNGVTPPRVIPPMAVPDYTDAARQARVQGTVILDVIIRADGTGKFIKIIRGLGYGLDEKAIEAFEKCRFEPGKKDGQPVDVELEITTNFKLY